MSDIKTPLSIRLRSGEYDGADIMQAYIAVEELEQLRAENERLRGALDRLLSRVNKVTSYHRHGRTVTTDALDNLANRQIEIEHMLKEPGNDE